MSGRIHLLMSVQDAVVALVDGNPGAARVCLELLVTSPNADPKSLLGSITPLLSLDQNRIYGSHIWLLYKDICGSDPVKVIGLLRAVQLGILRRAELIRGIASAERGPSSLTADSIEEVMAAVRKELPGFARGADAAR